MSGSERNGWQLSLERVIAAPPERVWRAMTERFTEWWCPKPWRTEVGAIEWRSGGPFKMVMRGPNPGDASPIDGVLLEVVPGHRFVYTDVVDADWKPHPPFMIGCFEIEPVREATRLTAWARHWDEASMNKHREMGFEEGWGIVAAQLAALVEGV